MPIFRIRSFFRREDNKQPQHALEGTCILFIFVPMVPDYPYKTFGDERRSYCLLMEVLAMGPCA
jgi:hypothetical protein